MLRLMIAAALVLAVSDARAASFCEKEWPDSYRMQRHCLEQQDKAIGSLAQWLDRYGVRTVNQDGRRSFDTVAIKRGVSDGKPWAELVANCALQWNDNLQMVWHCVEQEAIAAAQLGKKLD